MQPLLHATTPSFMPSCLPSFVRSSLKQFGLLITQAGRQSFSLCTSYYLLASVTIYFISHPQKFNSWEKKWGLHKVWAVEESNLLWMLSNSFTENHHYQSDHLPFNLIILIIKLIILFNLHFSGIFYKPRKFLM